MSHATHVAIDQEALAKEASTQRELYSTKALPPSWEQDYHFSDDTDLTAQYVLVLDALNFCFWPLPDYEYAQLAGSLKQVLVADKHAFDADNLVKMTAERLSTWLQPPLLAPSAPASREGEIAGDLPLAKRTRVVPQPVVIPLVEERARLLVEIGEELNKSYQGYASNVVRAAKGSALALVDLVTAAFPGFRDHAQYKGRQVFFYKRAQIFVGDIWGAYHRQGLGFFHDIDQLTAFADYRIPQLLHTIGILKYSPSLEKRVLAGEALDAGGHEELEIRAATVQAVELLGQALRRGKTEKKEEPREKTTKAELSYPPILLDWLLWERGEAQLNTLRPHHRCLTTYY